MTIEGTPGRSTIRSFACLALLLAPVAAQHELVVPDDPFAAVRAMPSTPAVDGGQTVCVRSADGEPLPDAVVVLASVYGQSYAAMRTACEQRFPGDEVRILAARATIGTRYAVDGDGTTRVPAKQRGRIIAIHRDRVASVVLDQNDRPRTIELQMQPAMTFAATVRTADGQPAVGVAIGVCGPNSRFAFPRTPTDANGRATFRLVAGRPLAKSRLMAVIAARDATMVKLPTADGAEAVLELPPCGSLRASLAEQLPPGSTCTWSIRSKSGTTATGVVDPNDPAKATFPFVEAGTVGTVSCFLDGSRHREITFGAVVAGQQKVVELPVPPGTTMVLRVLDPSGTPLPNTWVQYEWDYPRGSSSTGGKTNTAGWLTLDVPEKAINGATLELTATEGNWDGGLIGSASFEVGKVQEARVDRGDVKLVAGVVALSGRLVDERGEPVAGVRLEGRCDGSHDDYAAITATDGSFVLKTPANGTTVDVGLDTQDWFLDQSGQRTTVDFGSRDHRIVVLRAARVMRRAEGLGTNFDDNIEVSCEHPDDPSRRFVLSFDWQEPVFRMPAGEWDVVFRSRDAELHRVPKVIAQSGIEVHDPRFMFFDWQQFARMVTIEVQNRLGHPYDKCTVWQHHGSGASGGRPRKGVYRILLPKGGAHMTIDVDGRGHGDGIDLGTVTTDQIVRIDAGPRLLVELDALPELPAGTKLLAGVGEVWQPFDAQRGAALWLPEVERYRPRLAVERGGRRVVVDQELAATDVRHGGCKLAVKLDDTLRASVQHAVAQLQ